jgi:hypothetical protein
VWTSSAVVQFVAFYLVLLSQVTDIVTEEDEDEVAEHFDSQRPLHVLLTTCYKGTSIMYKFCADPMVCVTAFPEKGVHKGVRP